MKPGKPSAMREAPKASFVAWAVVAAALMAGFAWAITAKVNAGTFSWFDLVGPTVAVVGVGVLGLVGTRQLQRADPDQRQAVRRRWLFSLVGVAVLGFGVAAWLLLHRG